MGKFPIPVVGGKVRHLSKDVFQVFIFLSHYLGNTYNPPSSSVGLHVFLPGNLGVPSAGTVILYIYIYNWTLLILFILFYDCWNL